MMTTTTATLEFECPSCGYPVHAPSDDVWRCPECGNVIDLAVLRRERTTARHRSLFFRLTAISTVTLVLSGPLTLLAAMIADQFGWSFGRRTIVAVPVILVLTIPPAIAWVHDRRTVGIAFLTSLMCLLMLAALLGSCVGYAVVFARMDATVLGIIGVLLFQVVTVVAGLKLTQFIEHRCQRLRASAASSAPRTAGDGPAGDEPAEPAP